MAAWRRWAGALAGALFAGVVLLSGLTTRGPRPPEPGVGATARAQARGPLVEEPPEAVAVRALALASPSLLELPPPEVPSRSDPLDLSHGGPVENPSARPVAEPPRIALLAAACGAIVALQGRRPRSRRVW